MRIDRFSGSIDVYRRQTNDQLLRLPPPQPAVDPFQFGNFDASILNQGIEFHVCGNFASMMDVGRDDFVDFVSVAHRAPDQVEAFQEAGYRLVFVSKPK